VKPARFTYHRPSSIAEAVAVLREHGDEARPLAGGQSLVPLLALRLVEAQHLVDLDRIDGLKQVTITDRWVGLGAMVRQRTIERDARLTQMAPLIALATPFIGHLQVRNRGTVGGSLAHADPAAEYPAVALALGAEFELVGGMRPRIGAEAFFLGGGRTAIGPGELLVAINFPRWPPGSRFAIEEVARRHGDFALAGVAVALSSERAGIALFGVADTPVRAAAAESALLAGAPAGEVAHAAVRELDVRGDIYASSRTRRRLALHVVDRAVRDIQEVPHA
jgi:aerobic carbon-monoxide dehydrogenase medium subunit